MHANESKNLHGKGRKRGDAMKNKNDVNYVIFGKNLAASVGMQNDFQLAAFFDMLECRQIGMNFFAGTFIDGTIPLRVGILDDWDMLTCGKMTSSHFYIVAENVVPGYELRMKMEAFRVLYEQNGDTFDTAVFSSAKNGAALAKYRASQPANDTTKYPDYFGRFRSVAKQRPGESDSEHQFRLLQNFRLMFQFLQDNKHKQNYRRINNDTPPY